MKVLRKIFQFVVVAILVVKCAPVALAQSKTQCRVLDKDISGRYSGDCIDGLANGKGIASGRDRYEGEFVEGRKHGQGTYYWSDGAVFSGIYRSDLKESGRMQFPSGHPGIHDKSFQGKGNFIGGYYVIEGAYVRNTFAFRCTQLECERKLASLNASEAEAVDRQQREGPSAGQLKREKFAEQTGTIGFAADFCGFTLTKGYLEMHEKVLKSDARAFYLKHYQIGYDQGKGQAAIGGDLFCIAACAAHGPGSPSEASGIGAFSSCPRRK